MLEAAELLDAHTTGLRTQYDALLPVIDRAGTTLAGTIEKLAPDERADPEGEVARALEQGETCFKRRRQEFRHMHDAFAEVGAAPSHEVHKALDRLDNLYMWIVATMQEVRWSLLIADGIKDKTEAPEVRSLTSSSEWLAALHED